MRAGLSGWIGSGTWPSSAKCEHLMSGEPSVR